MTLGIDTSCYTTSVALAEDNQVIAQARKLLTVEAGARGLRQSDGVFQHVGRLPAMMDALFAASGTVTIDAVCVSGRPRDVSDSYMPVFTVGVSVARALARAMNVPYFETSHQRGHVRAAMEGTSLEAKTGGFVAVHLSGGTTETLAVSEGLQIERIGGSNDLHAGQLVDRVGVALGLPFPAGPALEALAQGGTACGRIPLSSQGTECSFSGAENRVKNWIAQEALAPADIAAEVYSFLARSVARLVMEAAHAVGMRDVLLAGGVASSALLRAQLPERLQKKGQGLRIHWAKPERSGDNACGVALLGEAFRRNRYAPIAISPV